MEDINRAVYAVCGALIKTKGLMGDALRVAGNSITTSTSTSNTTGTVPAALVRVWRKAQRVRATFDKLLQTEGESVRCEA